MTNNTTENVAVRVDGLSKTFRIPTEASSGIKQKIINTIKGKKGYREFTPLKDISFEINKGDFFGIVGRNGSGKSTLLKSIAGIYTPSEGGVHVDGVLVPFIELGVGFNPELTGRENVFLNGALLGFSHSEMEAMYDEIVDFAEIGDFMEEKLKNYSSGMQVRLAFSIAIRAEADVLLLDEVLAVGDEAFQRKCNDYFERIRKDANKTIILVTHSMESVRKYCNRAMLISEGEIKQIGSPDKVANAYSDIFINERIIELESQKNEVDKLDYKKISDVGLQDINIVQNEIVTQAVRFQKDFSLEVTLSSDQEYNDLTMGVHFFDQAGRDILAISTKTFGSLRLKKGSNLIRFDIQNIFTDGDYYINLAVEDNNTKQLLVQSHEISPFSVVGLNLTEYSKHSLTHPRVEVHFE